MKNPTIDELLRCVEASNRAAELHLKLPPAIRAKPNPLFDALYPAAVNAAQSLSPLMKVELKTISKT
jgi:hypothetical protein